MKQVTNSSHQLSPKVKILGTSFLIFQLLFAANNYGPQNIPGLNLFFTERWVAGDHNTQQESAELLHTIQLEDVTASYGLEQFISPVIDDNNPNYLQVMGGGVAVADFDSDGWEDLFLTSMPSIEESNSSYSASALYRNSRDGTFEKVTASAGLDNIQGYPTGALAFDFDNDGDQDLYVAAYDGGQLFRNNDGKFKDITNAAGLNLEGRCGDMPCFVSSATTADYNRDGLLDLLLVNNVSWDITNPDVYGEDHLFPAFFGAQASLLYKNNGDGSFTDVTLESGLDNNKGKGLSATWNDIDSDGWPDLYIANDLSKNQFYRNNSDGTFTEIASVMALDEIKSSMGVAASDYDNDGDTDYVTTNLKGTKLSLFKNLGDYRFEYATDKTGLASSSRSSGWGVTFVDLDLDGFQDLAVSGGPVWEAEPTDTENLYYRNIGNGSFQDITSELHLHENEDGKMSRGLAVIDADRSGQPDLIFAGIDGHTPQLMVNHSQNDHDWIKLKLEGTESNRDAIGARVQIVRTDGIEISREVRAGDSYLSSGSKCLYIGLGNAELDSLTVNWPSGKQEVHKNLPVNREILIRESDSVHIIEINPHRNF